MRRPNLRQTANQYTASTVTDRRVKVDVEDVAFVFRPDSHDWMRAGFTNHGDVSVWEATGWPPNVCAQLRRYGFDPDEAKDWCDTGLPSVSVIQAREDGFGPDEAAGWRDAGFGPDEAATLRDQGLTVAAAKKQRSGR